MGFVNSSGMRVAKDSTNNYINSKFGKHPITGVLVDAGVGYLSKKGLEASHKVAHSVNKKLREMTKDFSITPNLKVGVIDNGKNSVINSAYKEISYKHTVSSASLSSTADTRIYRTTFQVGVPTSNSLYEFAKNKTIDTKVLVDTERDYLSTAIRSPLTMTFGFNQRSYNFFLNHTFMSVGDYAFLFKKFEKQFTTKLSNINVYGNIFYEHLNLRIKSETDYYSIRLKLHLVKINNPGLNVIDLFNNTFHMEKGVSNPNYKVPVDRQVSEKPEIHSSLRCDVLTDLKCTLGLSDFFKENAVVVKTFSRTLGPNDIWDFKYFLHYGPGILLNKIFEQSSFEKFFKLPSQNQHPAGYFFILQSEGDPRASMTRTNDGQNFNGSSPGRFNLNFRKELKFVKDPNRNKEIMTIREFVKNDEDFEDIELQEYFTPNRSTKINVDWSGINTNRLEDNQLEYQLRYGEGRLTVYMDPALREYIKRSKEVVGNYAKDAKIESESTPDPAKDPESFLRGNRQVQGQQDLDIDNIMAEDILGED